ncbi:hypothetical protein BVI434_310053 [Burkholderia vietnamiensis]|nr:hypothetical protein BVI434_310053 [Burkholderia vietnamiensis]
MQASRPSLAPLIAQPGQRFAAVGNRFFLLLQKLLLAICGYSTAGRPTTIRMTVATA